MRSIWSGRRGKSKHKPGAQTEATGEGLLPFPFDAFALSVGEFIQKVQRKLFLDDFEIGVLAFDEGKVFLGQILWIGKLF